MSKDDVDGQGHHLFDFPWRHDCGGRGRKDAEQLFEGYLLLTAAADLEGV